jgi:hypothetical protein
MRTEGAQRRTTEYNGVSLRKDDLCAVVTVRLSNPLSGYD